MEVSVYNIQGQETGKKVTLNDAIFGIEPNDHAIYLDVKQLMANSRQGTHKSKQRAEIAGSTKKIKKQKGTGTARAGSMKNPLFKGGGRIFGPVPRDYDIKLNRKVKILARKSALSHKIKDNSIKILEDFSFEAPKTKQILEILNNLKVEKKSLLVLSEQNKNIYLSARNLKNAKVVNACDVTTYDIMNAENIFIVESSVAVIDKILINE